MAGLLNIEEWSLEMSKKVTIGLAAMLVASSYAPTVFADTSTSEEQQEEKVLDEVVDTQVEDTSDVENNEEITEDGNSAEEGSEEPVELIDSLTLEQAIDLGLKNNFSLLTLELRLQNVKSQLVGSEDANRELLNDIKDLEDEMDDLKEQEGTFASRYQIQEALEDMEDALESIEDGTESLKTSVMITEYTNQQTDETMKFQIASNFVQLKMQEEQIKLLKESLQTQVKEVAKDKVQFELGMLSKVDFETAEREVTRLEAQIAEAEENLQKDLAVFALEIGVVYHPELKLVDPEMGELQLITQETDTEALIENSYSMKIAQENLALQRYNREQVYADDDLEAYDREQADIAVELEQTNISDTKVNAEQAIAELYTSINSQYNSILDAERELDYAKEDNENLKKRYEAGLIARHTYESAAINTVQAEASLQLEKYNYYLLQKQAELLEAGVIL